MCRFSVYAGGEIYMRTLLMDVSTLVMYVGIARDDVLLDHSMRIAKRDHAKYMVDRVEKIIERNRLTLDQIDRIVVGIGPGSYTGIRIATTVAKMLGFAKEIPVYTVSSLYFMTSGYEGKIAALIDARRGYVFAQIHEDDQVILDDTYVLLESLKQEESFKQAKTVFIDERHYEVSPKHIFTQMKKVEDIHALIPNYLRKTEAENNYDKASKNK